MNDLTALHVFGDACFKENLKTVLSLSVTDCCESGFVETWDFLKRGRPILATAPPRHGLLKKAQK